MAKQIFKVDIDLEQNQLLQARVQNEPDTNIPASPEVGQIYYDTTVEKMGIYTQSNGWMYFVAGSSSGSGYLTNINAPQTAITVSISGTVATLTIANATTTEDGLMSAGDKTKLDNATSANTASTLVERDASGVISVSQITISGTPQNPTDAATKGYVDGLVQGLKTKLPARAIATTNITLSGPQTIDGVALVANNRVLVAGQTTASANGIYIVKSGAWTRADDLPTGSAAANIYLFIEEGTLNADTGWVCTNNTGSDVVGTAGLTFVKFSSAGVIEAGNGLTKTGNMLNVGTSDGSITVNPNGIQVKRDPDGGIGVDTNGISVTPKTDGGITVDNDGVSVKADASRATTVTADGVGVNVEGTDVIIDGNDEIALGNRVTKTVYKDVTLAAGTATTITHGLSTKNVNVTIIDQGTGEHYMMNVTHPDANTVAVTSNSVESVRVIISGAVGVAIP